MLNSCRWTHVKLNNKPWNVSVYNFFPLGTTLPSRPESTHSQGFTITLRHTALGRTPLDEWSARWRNLYLTTHNTHARHTLMFPAEFEFAIPAGERPPSRRKAANPSLRPRGQYDRRSVQIRKKLNIYKFAQTKLAQTGSSGDILFVVLLTEKLPPHHSARSKLRLFSKILNTNSKFQIQIQSRYC